VRRVGRELKVTVEIAGGDAPVERIDELLDVHQLDDAFHLLPWHETQRRRGDDAEESVTAHRMTKQLGVRGSAARDHVAIARDDFERFEIVDERGGGETAPVNVCSDCAADGEPIGAGLLLADSPRWSASVGPDEISADYIGPRDAGLDSEQPAILVEAAHPLELAHVEQGATGEKLLTAHRVTPAGDGQSFAASGGGLHRANHVFDGARFDRTRHRGLVERGVRVVDSVRQHGGAAYQSGSAVQRWPVKYRMALPRGAVRAPGTGVFALRGNAEVACSLLLGSTTEDIAMRKILVPTILATACLAFFAGCTPTRTTKSAGEQIDDSAITARVKTELAQKVGTGDSIRTDVETFRGRVQLNGFVDSAEKKAEASRAARSVKGVKSVENNLSVSTTKRTTGEYVDDKIILAKVKAALAADSTVAAHNVNLEVRQGVVQLAGFVDNADQKSRAGQLAKEVAGVSRVDNQIEVKRR